jgi:hypothetical protein
MSSGSWLRSRRATAAPFTRLIPLALLVFLLALSARAQQPLLVFDSLSNAQNDALPQSTPRTFIGQAFGIPGEGAPVAVTSMELVLRHASPSAVTYENIRVNVQFWDACTNATTGAAPVFSSPCAGGVRSFDLGARTLAASASELVILNFAPPVVLRGDGSLGVTVHIQGDTGAGLRDTDDLTAGLRGGGVNVNTPEVGFLPTNPNRGGNTFYYRNASGGRDYNFRGADARDLGDASDPATGIGSALQMRLFAIPRTALRSL